jgi:hypothetical protein
MYKRREGDRGENRELQDRKWKGLVTTLLRKIRTGSITYCVGMVKSEFLEMWQAAMYGQLLEVACSGYGRNGEKQTGDQAGPDQGVIFGGFIRGAGETILMSCACSRVPGRGDVGSQCGSSRCDARLASLNSWLAFRALHGLHPGENNENTPVISFPGRIVTPSLCCPRRCNGHPAQMWPLPIRQRFLVEEDTKTTQ